MSQAPRNVYGTGQTKQSVGVYTSNYRNRMDGTANVLMCPQKPLIQIGTFKNIQWLMIYQLVLMQ